MGQANGHFDLAAGDALTQIIGGHPAAMAVPLAVAWPAVLGLTLSLAAGVAALVVARRFFSWVEGRPAGDETMVRIAGYVRDGADAYLISQYKVTAIVFVVVAVLLAVMAFVLNVQSAAAPFLFLIGGVASAVAGWAGMKTATMASSRTAEACKTSLDGGLQVAFKSGAVMGLTVVGLGLATVSVTYAMLHYGFGLSLASTTTTLLCFGMGASCQALFARVGGGIFTKAADVGADLVGKVEAGIPEDDPRNPATIADNVGDNVGDVAGMGADLFESYCGSVIAASALGVAAFRGFPELQAGVAVLPMLLAAAGIGLSIFGVGLVKANEGATQKQLLHALGRAVNITALGVSVVAAVLIGLMLVWPTSGMSEELAAAGLPSGTSLMGVWVAMAIGLLGGILIGVWTERCTSDVYPATRRIADQAATGPATVIISGIAEGMASVWVPVLVVGAAILIAFGSCTGFDFEDPSRYALGLFGVAISAVGMLSTLGLTLATDAYGPIADNAGGNAEMSHLPPEVRQRTDALDSLGNTTAATGKGFAIGSAALTALALLASYMEEGRQSFARAIPKTAAEAAAVSPYSEAEGLLTLTVEGDGRSTATPYLVMTRSRAEVGQRVAAFREAADADQFMGLVDLEDRGEVVAVSTATIPDFVRYFDISMMNPRVLVGMLIGVMLAFTFCAMTMQAVGRVANRMVDEVRRQFKEIAGIMEGTATPEYGKCIDISTRAAQGEIIGPALLAILAPVFTGLVLGVGGVIGLLAGGLTSGFALAIFMANSGGAWDNAKKYIEAGHLGGKNTDAHAAAVIGDTVGDPFKDTSGPSLNILIKLMAMVSVVSAGLVIRYGGWL